MTICANGGGVCRFIVGQDARHGITTENLIDGEAGTTGLQIASRLAARRDLELLRLDDSRRKDDGARRAQLNAADLVVLCLPDDAAKQAVTMVENPSTRIIDASSAHRVSDGWEYGFPEYDHAQRQRLRNAKRISNPGCYAVAAVAIIHPLVEAGLIPADWPITITGVSGYSGGGKTLIAAFEDDDHPAPIHSAVYHYGLTLNHKHVPEISRWGGLSHAPIFLPTVGRYYRGMLVQLPVPLWALPRELSARDLHEALRVHYHGEEFVRVAAYDEAGDLRSIDPEDRNDTNELRLYVLHNESTRQCVVVAQLDNLGKGASGQAVQCLNLVLGFDERLGLVDR